MTHKLHDALDRKLFLKNYFPQAFEAYKLVAHGSAKADIWRLAYLLKYGGIYLDIDFTFYKNLHTVINTNADFISICSPHWQNSILNGLLGCPPNSKLIRKCLETAIFNIMNTTKQDRLTNQGHSLCGPYMIHKVLCNYYGLSDHHHFTEGCHVYNGDTLQFLCLKNPKDKIVTWEDVPILNSKFPEYIDIKKTTKILN